MTGRKKRTGAGGGSFPDLGIGFALAGGRLLYDRFRFVAGHKNHIHIYNIHMKYFFRYVLKKSRTAKINTPADPVPGQFGQISTRSREHF